jgi:hypothetical protein
MKSSLFLSLPIIALVLFPFSNSFGEISENRIFKEGSARKKKQQSKELK